MLLVISSTSQLKTVVRKYTLMSGIDFKINLSILELEDLYFYCALVKKVYVSL